MVSYSTKLQLKPWYRQSLICHKYYLQLLTFYRTQVLVLPHALVKC